MPMFRKKPVVIEARLFEDSAACRNAILRWLDEHETPGIWDADGIHIETLEGRMLARPGDYVIRGVKGEFYPCKPDIFAATYEPAEAARSLRGATAPRDEAPNDARIDGHARLLSGLQRHGVHYTVRGEAPVARLIPGEKAPDQGCFVAEDGSGEKLCRKPTWVCLSHWEEVNRERVRLTNRLAEIEPSLAREKARNERVEGLWRLWRIALDETAMHYVERDRMERCAAALYTALVPLASADDFGTCPATRGVFNCTLPPGHEGDHVAQGAPGQECERWSDVTIDFARVEELIDAFGNQARKSEESEGFYAARTALLSAFGVLARLAPPRSEAPPDGAQIAEAYDAGRESVMLEPSEVAARMKKIDALMDAFALACARQEVTPPHGAVEIGQTRRDLRFAIEALIPVAGPRSEAGRETPRDSRAERITFAFNVFKAETERVKEGAEDPTKGCSIYNWRIFAVREIERLADSITTPEDLEPAGRSTSGTDRCPVHGVARVTCSAMSVPHCPLCNAQHSCPVGPSAPATTPPGGDER